MMQFTKMHGLGNDFVMINGFREQLPEEALSNLAVKMCHRRLGIGADGLILLLPSDKDTLRMRIINSDGTEAEMCGNGIRCFALFAREQGIVTTDHFTVETLAGSIGIQIKEDNLVTVDMGCPVLSASEIPVVGDGQVIDQPIQLLDKEFHFTAVSMGNPHSVIFVDDAEHFPLATYGPVSEKHSFFPAKVNTEFVQVLSRDSVRMRVWERGCGETMACGTGACATTVAAILNGLTNRTVHVVLDGGVLEVTWDEATGKVFMTGAAAFAFQGEYLG